MDFLKGGHRDWSVEKIIKEERQEKCFTKEKGTEWERVGRWRI